MGNKIDPYDLSVEEMKDCYYPNDDAFWISRKMKLSLDEDMEDTLKDDCEEDDREIVSGWMDKKHDNSLEEDVTDSVKLCRCAFDSQQREIFGFVF